MKRIIVYCDGGCRGNGNENNVGGWGVLLQYGEHKKELYGSTYNTTNNAMELLSCIKALEAIKDRGIPVEVVSDSQYVVQGISQWVYGWIKSGLVNSSRQPVKNKELWQQLLDIKKEFSDVTFTKCKGHSDNLGNNRADALANLAMDGPEAVD